LQRCSSSNSLQGPIEDMEALFGITKEKMKELLSVA